MRVDTRKGSSIGKSCPRSCPSLSLTLFTLHPQSASTHHPGETPVPHRPVPARAKPSPLSFGARGHPSACSWRLRRRRQASLCYLANRTLWPPSTMPNGWPPPMPSVGHSLAHALTTPMHALDAKSGIDIPKHACPFFPHTAHHPARYRSPDNMPPLPCTLGPPLVLAMSRKACTSTEP
jgi:hypothetical protein